MFLILSINTSIYDYDINEIFFENITLYNHQYKLIGNISNIKIIIILDFIFYINFFKDNY